MSKFKRAFSINQIVMNLLVKKHIVELQQSGFPAHSLMHNKIVVVRKPDLLQYYVKNQAFLLPLEKQPVKKANREGEHYIEQKAEPEVFDYLNYQDWMMAALPSEMVINTEVLDHLLYFITDCIPDVEEDRNCEKVEQYARMFVEWEKGTLSSNQAIPSPSELGEQKSWEEAKKLSKLI